MLRIWTFGRYDLQDLRTTARVSGEVTWAPTGQPARARSVAVRHFPEMEPDIERGADQPQVFLVLAGRTCGARAYHWWAPEPSVGQLVDRDQEHPGVSRRGRTDLPLTKGAERGTRL